MKFYFNSDPKRLLAKMLLLGFVICCFNLLCLLPLTLSAQDGVAGINQATSQIQRYFSAGANLMYAIGAVMGIVGAIKVYNKWNAGEPDTNKLAAAWFGSLIFLVVVVAIIESFFGV
jgi:hypothetical protein